MGTAALRARLSCTGRSEVTLGSFFCLKAEGGLGRRWCSAWPLHSQQLKKLCCLCIVPWCKGQLRKPSQRHVSDQTEKQSSENQYHSNSQIRCERDFLNSNNKGPLSWPKGDKDTCPSYEQGWKILGEETRDFFWSTVRPHLTCNSYARPGPPPHWGISECCMDAGRSHSRTDMASRLVVPSSFAFPYNLHHWLWNILGERKDRAN